MKLKFGSWLLTPYLMVVLFLGLQACGGGGSPTPTTTAAVNTSLTSAARGYYDGTGLIAGGSQADINISTRDIRAIFDEKEFVIAYKLGADPILFYKGTFTEVTSTSFKADIRVYVNGIFTETATITNGVIDEGISLTGAIVGAGDYASSVGDITLAYTSDNSLTPPDYKFGVSNVWQDDPSTGTIQFSSTTKIDFSVANDAVPLDISSCLAMDFNTSDVINEQTGRIRAFTTSPLDCDDTITLDGYFTNFNSGAVDDRIFVVASNDDYSYIGILPCVIGTCF